MAKGDRAFRELIQSYEDMAFSDLPRAIRKRTDKLMLLAWDLDGLCETFVCSLLYIDRTPSDAELAFYDELFSAGLTDARRESYLAAHLLSRENFLLLYKALKYEKQLLFFELALCIYKLAGRLTPEETTFIRTLH